MVEWLLPSRDNFDFLFQLLTMQIERSAIEIYNESLYKEHQRKYSFICGEIENAEGLLQKLIDFQVAIPTWALGTGGTRFGRFSGGGEPRTLEEKIEDVGLLHALNKSSGAISLHIPWDIPRKSYVYQSIGSTAWYSVRCYEFKYFPGSARPTT